MAENKNPFAAYLPKNDTESNKITAVATNHERETAPSTGFSSDSTVEPLLNVEDEMFESRLNPTAAAWDPEKFQYPIEIQNLGAGAVDKVDLLAGEARRGVVIPPPGDAQQSVVPPSVLPGVTNLGGGLKIQIGVQATAKIPPSPPPGAVENVKAGAAHKGKSPELSQIPVKRVETNIQRLANIASAYEPFSVALLHCTSPFMPPLRALCRTALPHIKVDQRYGRCGKPETAVSQFVIAPVVSNYRPRHFHEVTDGDLLEYHHDLARVLSVLDTAATLIITYGSEAHPHRIPYAYLACESYAEHVKRLCPHEIPNSASERLMEGDIVKDITKLLLAVPEVAVLRTKSFVSALESPPAERVTLSTIYAIFNDIFSSLSNYEIQIRNLHETPSVFLLKASRGTVQAAPEPLLIAGQPIWDLLPSVTCSPPSVRRVVTTSTTSLTVVKEDKEGKNSPHRKINSADDGHFQPKESAEKTADVESGSLPCNNEEKREVTEHAIKHDPTALSAGEKLVLISSAVVVVASICIAIKILRD